MQSALHAFGAVLNHFLRSAAPDGHTARVPRKKEDAVGAKAAARQATKDALLQAAAGMLFDAPAADPIGALRPTEVVRRAVPPRSNGAFYNIWPTQEAFRRDLLHHVLSVDRIEVGRPTAEAGAELAAAPHIPVAETVRLLANLNFDGIKEDPSMRLRIALWTRHGVDPDVRELLEALYDGVTTLFTPMYAGLVEKAGRRMRPPFTIETLAVALASLSEGLHTRWTVQPGAVPDDLGPDADPDHVDRRWSLFAAVTYMIFLGMTEPV
jgi:hypothetical protein